MSITISYFVHGATNDNENNIISGWSDIGLSELGIRQAEELRDLIADKQYDLIYCSDLRRAVETTKIAFSSRDVIKDIRLREIDFGKLTKCSTELLVNHRNIFKSFPGGESYKDVEIRLNNFINYLKNNYYNKNIAVLSHWVPQLAFEVLVNELSWDDAFSYDWRLYGAWRPGWIYKL